MTGLAQPAPDLWQLAMLAAALMALGAAVLAMLTAVPATAAAARPIWPVFGSAVLVVACVTGLLLVSGPVLVAALMLFAARGTWEAAHLHLPGAARALGLAAALTVPAAAVSGAARALAVLGLLWVAALLVRAALTIWPRAPGHPVPAILDILLYPLLPLAGFAAAAADPVLGVAILATFILVETLDSYAFLVGRLFGRRPAFPRLSPRKSVEGLAGGAAMLALTAALAGPLVLGVPPLAAVAIASAVGVLALAGDLAASRIKRLAGAKDYPVVLARQGGLLDIADAWIAAGAGIALGLVLLA